MIDGDRYIEQDMTEKEKALFKKVQELELLIEDKKNIQRLFRKAKYAYVNELKQEILCDKAGIGILFD